MTKTEFVDVTHKLFEEVIVPMVKERIKEEVEVRFRQQKLELQQMIEASHEKTRRILEEARQKEIFITFRGGDPR